MLVDSRIGTGRDSAGAARCWHRSCALLCNKPFWSPKSPATPSRHNDAYLFRPVVLDCGQGTLVDTACTAQSVVLNCGLEPVMCAMLLKQGFGEADSALACHTRHDFQSAVRGASSFVGTSRLHTTSIDPRTEQSQASSDQQPAKECPLWSGHRQPPAR